MTSNHIRQRLAIAALLAIGSAASHAGTMAHTAKVQASTAPTTTAAAHPAVAAQPAAPPAAHFPKPSALETQTGIQITQVGVTASGGLIDVRFRVLDAAKARKLLADPANAPMLVAGDQPPLMAPHHALKGARYSNGQVFFILYPNARGAIKPGAPVTVAMGPVRLGPVKAQ